MYRWINFFFSKITLPTGARVMFSLARDNWFSNIYVYPSIFDEDNVDGMCGNPNNIASDDFIDNLKLYYSNQPDYHICKANQAIWRYSNTYLYPRILVTTSPIFTKLA